MVKYGVFICGLPGDCQERDLLKLLKSFAKVTSIKLARGRNQPGEQFCLGYGFAACRTSLDETALITAPEVAYKGRRVTIKPYKEGRILKSEQQNFKLRRLFVGNIHQKVTEENLRPYLEQVGVLEVLYFVEQSKNMKFKYGYAVYHSKESAQRAVQELSDHLVYGSKIRIEFAGNNTIFMPTKQFPGSDEFSPQKIDNNGSPVSNNLSRRLFESEEDTSNKKCPKQQQQPFQEKELNCSLTLWQATQSSPREAGERYLPREANIASLCFDTLLDPPSVTEKSFYTSLRTASLNHTESNIRINKGGSRRRTH